MAMIHKYNEGDPVIFENQTYRIVSIKGRDVLIEKAVRTGIFNGGGGQIHKEVVSINDIRPVGAFGMIVYYTNKDEPVYYSCELDFAKEIGARAKNVERIFKIEEMGIPRLSIDFNGN